MHIYISNNNFYWNYTIDTVAFYANDYLLMVQGLRDLWFCYHWDLSGIVLDSLEGRLSQTKFCCHWVPAEIWKGKSYQFIYVFVRILIAYIKTGVNITNLLEIWQSGKSFQTS